MTDYKAGAGKITMNQEHLLVLKSKGILTAGRRQLIKRTQNQPEGVPNSQS